MRFAPPVSVRIFSLAHSKEKRGDSPQLTGGWGLPPLGADRVLGLRSINNSPEPVNSESAGVAYSFCDRALRVKNCKALH
jgi:hypothetical protein